MHDKLTTSLHELLMEAQSIANTTGSGLVEPEPSPQKTSPEPREYEEAPGARLLQVEDVDFVVDVSSDEDDAKINNDSEVINVSDIEDIVSISSDEESA